MARRKNREERPKVKLTKEGLKQALSIFKYIKPYRGYFAAAMLFLVIGSLTFMVLMGLPGEMTNIAVGKPKFGSLNLEVKDFKWIFVAILAFQGVLSYMRTYFFAIVSERGMADLRKDLYDKIISQPVYFFEGYMDT